MRNRNLHCVIGVVIALVLCANPVMASIAEDDFTGGLAAGLWHTPPYENNAGKINAVNNRLEYTSTADSTSNESIAHYSLLDKDMAYDSTWTATVDVHVGDYSSSISATEYEYAADMGVYVPGSGSGVSVELVRSKEGGENESSLNWASFNEWGDGDEDAESWFASASSDTGSLKLVWNKDGNHEFDAYYSEGGGWLVIKENISTSLWDLDSSDVMRISTGGFDWNVDIALGTGSNITVDNFVLVPEPATLTLTVMGAIALLRRKRRA